jgi:hypothetical protein
MKYGGITMRIIKKKGLIEEKISERELLLHDEGGEQTHLLSYTAGVLYKLCGGVTVDEAVSGYIDAFSGAGVNADKLRADAHKIIAMLKEKDVIWEEEIA